MTCSWFHTDLVLILQLFNTYIFSEGGGGGSHIAHHIKLFDERVIDLDVTRHFADSYHLSANVDWCRTVSQTNNVLAALFVSICYLLHLAYFFSTFRFTLANFLLTRHSCRYLRLTVWFPQSGIDLFKISSDKCFKHSSCNLICQSCLKTGGKKLLYDLFSLSPLETVDCMHISYQLNPIRHSPIGRCSGINLLT